MNGAGGRSAASWVARERLLDQLAGASAASVVVVSAAAGSGKSTLASQWAAADRRPHTSVALAAHLDDPAALGALLVERLEQFGPPAPQTRAVVTGTEPAFSAVLLPALSDLAASRTHPFVLVLDDAHLLRRPECHQLLEAVGAGLPAGSSLALLTRDATPAWLARARTEGSLVEVRDLAFDRDEAAQLFAANGIAVDRPTLDGVLETSEGWAVGLYLAALARRDGRSSRSGDFHRFVHDYLVSEVLEPLGPADQRFLLETSILDVLEGPLVSAVTGRRDAEAVLNDLSRRLQLVIDLGIEPQRYRYHHLLSESLLTRLRQTDPAAEAVLHGRAARWLAAHGQLDAAIRHARNADDLALVGELVWSGIVPCIGSGRPDRLRSWLDDIPDSALEAEPWLALAGSWLALQEGDGTRMQRLALVSERHAGRGWRQRVSSDPYAAFLATLVVLIGQPLDAVIVLTTDALEGLPADSGFRPATCWLLGVAQTLIGQLDEGHQSMIEAERLATALDVPVIRADSLAFLGVLALLGGERDRGVRQVNRAIDLIEEHDLDRLATSAHTVTAQAFALAVVGDRRTAAGAFTKARRLSGLATDIAPWFAVLGRLIQARTAMLLGEGQIARILVDEAVAQMTPDLAGTLLEPMIEDTREAVRSMALHGGSVAALTSAELRVLQFLPSHLSFPQIAERLFLSPNTIKTHALSIYRKFGVSSRTEAVAVAQRLGLVEMPPRD